MSEHEEDPDTSHWKTISAEELAASRRQAVRARLAGPRSWLEGFISVLEHVLESELADHSLDPVMRETAETNLETLRNQAPALLQLLDHLPSSSRDGAFSIVLNLLSAVRGSTISNRTKSAATHQEAAAQTKIAEVEAASLLFAEDFVKKEKAAQAGKASEANSLMSARKQAIAAPHKRLPHKEALPFVNADLKKHGYDAISLPTLYKWWPKRKPKPILIPEE